MKDLNGTFHLPAFFSSPTRLHGLHLVALQSSHLLNNLHETLPPSPVQNKPGIASRIAFIFIFYNSVLEVSLGKARFQLYVHAFNLIVISRACGVVGVLCSLPILVLKPVLTKTVPGVS